MNKKNLFSAFAVAAFAVAMTSCDNSPKQDAEPVAAQTNPTELRIAYVEVDSIMSQYQFCKDNSIILQQRLGSELQAENEKFNTALHDSIQNFLNVYNKDKKFSLILSKAGDNILYADKAHDITKQVIAGLNKAYKKPADMGKATGKKEEKK